MTLADGSSAVSGDASVSNKLTTSSLKLGATDIVASGDELNILSGVTSTASDINKVGGITNGSVLANKALY